MVNPQPASSIEEIGSQNRQSNRTLEIAEMTDAEWDQFIASERGKFLK